ncbi:hypothetical protein F4806DRAFT_279974 [Annulohypoxylon nitens]|nr:hypothetical protein F4806DRAFT_279974 [Annulohypoxylon nitens]
MVGKPKSCTACRQAKTACDVRRTAPNSCSRCIQKVLSCRFDQNFKRVSQRQLARDIANGVHVVRLPPNGVEGSIVVNDHAESGLVIENTGFQLGDFSVSSMIVADLFQHFDDFYSPHAPFLQPIISPDRLSLDSQFLFWTILLITCQHHEVHHNLYNKLFFAHRGLLSSFLTRAIHSIQEIHALLLLSMWSLPANLPIRDPTLTYVTIATDACLKMNFHKPLSQDHVAHGWASWLNSEETTIQIQYLTWLACFSMSTQVAIYQGILPPLASFHHLRYVKKAIECLALVLDTEYRASIAIYECICNYSIPLEDVETSATQLSLLQAFESNLDTIEQTYATHSTPNLDIQLQYAKLNLYSLASLAPSNSDAGSDTHTLVTAQALLTRSLESASRVIHQTRSLNHLPFYPRQYLTNTFFASIYLFRILASCRPLSPSHAALALSSIAVARDTFHSIPSKSNRTASLSSDFLRRVHERAQALCTSSTAFSLPRPQIANRLGASLVYDTIFRVRFSPNQPNHDDRTKDKDKDLMTENRRSEIEHAENIPQLNSSVVVSETHTQPQLPSVEDQQPAFDMTLTQCPGDDFWLSWDTLFDNTELSFDQQLFL